MKTRESFVFFSFFLNTVSGVSGFDEGKSDTFTLWKRDGWGLAVTDDEQVAESGGEDSASGVSDVTDIVGSEMLFDGVDDTDSSDVVSSGKHNSGSVDELDNTVDVLGGKVKLDGVSNLDVWMWELDGSSVMGDDVWDLVLSDGLLDNLAELVTGLGGFNSVGIEFTLGVKENSEMLVGLLDGDDVHGTEWESEVSSDLSVNLDETFLVVCDLSGFISRDGILESLLEEDAHWDTFSQLVWTSRWSGGVDTLQFTEIPCLWCCNSLYDLSLSFIAHFVYCFLIY